MESRTAHGILAQFDSPDALYHACKEVKKQGFKEWDCYSPFPVHGIDKVMGLKQSKLPWIVGATALVCGGGGFLTWSWMNTIDYKFVIAGKPFYSWPAYFLPGFECAVLSAAIACLIGMFALNKLPRWYNPLLNSERFKYATDDKFYIFIEAKDSKFDQSSTKSFLKNTGASFVEIVHE